MVKNFTIQNAANGSTPTVAYNTSSPKFGTAALSGGCGATANPGTMGTGDTGTWECWMKAASPPGGIQVILCSIGNRYFGVNADGTPRFNIQNPDTSISGSVSICDGSWHHMALVTTSAGFKGYIDGVQVATSAVVNNAAESAPLYVRQLGPGSFPFNGEIDEIALWDYAKYTSTFTPPAAPYVGNESGLLALYHLDSNGTDSVGAGPSPATAITMSGPTGGVSGVPSTNFTVGANGTITGTIVVTPSDGGAGGTFTPTTVSISSGTPTGTFTYTPSSAGAKTISVTNNGSLTNPSNITYTATAPSATEIATNNAAIVYSPGNWNVSGSAAITINAGAYFSLLTNTDDLTLKFDVSGNSAPLPQVSYRIDGGPWLSSVIASTVALTMRSASSTLTWHLLEVMVKSTTETQNRWSGAAAAVKLTSITVTSGASVAAPTARPKKVLFFGDSITEAVRTLGVSGTDTDLNDAHNGWASYLGEALGVEYGVVGFGGQGFTQGGSGSVPALPTSMQSIYSGVSRSWAGVTGVVINMGTNDSGSVTSAATTVLNYIFTQAPSCLVVVLRPFNGTAQAANLQAAIAACSTPASVEYIDTAGMFDNSLGGDGLHPTAVNNMAQIGPELLPLVKAALEPHRFTVDVV